MKSEYTDICQGWYSFQFFFYFAPKLLILSDTVDSDGFDGWMLSKEGQNVVGLPVPNGVVTAAVGPDGRFVIVPENDMMFRKQGLLLGIVNRHRLAGDMAQYLPDPVGVGVVVLFVRQRFTTGQSAKDEDSGVGTEKRFESFRSGDVVIVDRHRVIGFGSNDYAGLYRQQNP